MPAPWRIDFKKNIIGCFHYVALEELAQQYDATSGLVVAKMDGTTNEAAGLDVKGFPSLRLYASAMREGAENGPAQRQDANGLVYEGDRSVAALTSWIEAHTGVQTVGKRAHQKTKEDL